MIPLDVCTPIRGGGKVLALVLAVLAGTLLWPGRGRADLADGTLLGVSTLLDSGDPATKLDIVFLGDGFTATEQDLFNDKVSDAAYAFLAAHPFLALRCAFNLHRVNVASAESGTDIPASCKDTPGTTPRSRRTAMNTTYCSGGQFYRCVGSPNLDLVSTWAANAPGADFIVVLVNDTGYGGCRTGNITFTTLDDSFTRIVVHELGHAISNLADEYSDDDTGKTTFTGSEPGRANLTIATTLGDLKWNDLVLSGTPIPTSTCATPRSEPLDIVGTFEGANQMFTCGIFRPQIDCRMRHSDQPFCSVCRRKLIRDIERFLCCPLSVRFTELLVRDAQEPWWRGSGEIYFNYQIVGPSEAVSGRWPGSEGEWDFDDGQTRSLNNWFAGTMAGDAGSLATQVRESDWPDGDDGLSSDASIALAGPGAFEIDQPDYRLRGNVVAAKLSVLLDMLHIKDDGDGFLAGSGDIYVRYTVSNGSDTFSGRWPTGGTVGIGDGETREVGMLAGAIPEPGPGGSLTIHIEVWDEDGWFTFGDDRLGEDTFNLDAAGGFGNTNVVHVEDHDNYRLTYSVARCP
jgi:hypothetical protein